MRRGARARRLAARKRKAMWFAGVCGTGVLGLMGVLWAISEEPLDSQGCPEESGPSREVIVLLDDSDPLTEKHLAEWSRIVREMTNPAESARHSSLTVRVGERVSLYRLQSDGPPETPVEQICHPGNPESVTGSGELTRWQRVLEFLKQLTTGTYIANWRWQQFVNTLSTAFPVEEGSEPESPILETIAVIAPRHAPSSRAPRDATSAHLIVISDLLQNTASLSHYGGYPKPDMLPAELRTDLSRVEVTLFRLEREKYAPYQTPDHYYWWADWAEELTAPSYWLYSL